MIRGRGRDFRLLIVDCGLWIERRALRGGIGCFLTLDSCLLASFFLCSLAFRAAGDKWAGPAVQPYLRPIGQHRFAVASGGRVHPPPGEALDGGEAGEGEGDERERRHGRNAVKARSGSTCRGGRWKTPFAIHGCQEAATPLWEAAAFGPFSGMRRKPLEVNEGWVRGLSRVKRKRQGPGLAGGRNGESRGKAIPWPQGEEAPGRGF